LIFDFPLSWERDRERVIQKGSGIIITTITSYELTAILSNKSRY